MKKAVKLAKARTALPPQSDIEAAGRGTKSIVKVTRTKGTDKRVGISLSFQFEADDPQAERMYRGVGLLLREALTDAEAAEFMRQFEAEKKKAGIA